MATVGNIKAKMVLETAEYMASADKVVGKTRAMGKGIEDALKRAATQWKQTLGKSAMALVGVSMADSLVKAIDERMKDPMFDNIGKNLAYAVSEGFKKSLESLPVVGTIGGWIGSGIGAATDFVGLTSDASGQLEARQQASRDQAAKMQQMFMLVAQINQPLERQLQLSSAINDAERTRLERSFQLQDMLKKINDQGIAAGMSGDEIRARSDEVRQQFEATMKAVDKRKADEEAVARSMKEQAEAADRLAREEQRLQQIAEQRQATADNFLEGLQKQLEQETLTETELFELQLQRLNLTAEEIRAAREIQQLRDDAVRSREAEAQAIQDAAQAETEAAANMQAAQAAATRAMEFSNVESLGTAIGGVKVAGMTDNSLARLVPTQEAMKNYLAQIEKNTQPHAGGAP